MARRKAARARAARVAAVILVVAAVLAGLGYGVSQLGGGSSDTAPWAQPDAPDVHPAPLSEQ